MVAARTLIAVVAALAWLAGATRAPAEDCVAITDFSTGKVGEFPPDWKPRKDSGRAVYSIKEEGGRRFLHAASQGQGVQAAKEFAWDLNAYPILAWSWRPLVFPQGSDERKSSANDSVLSVYAVFPHTSWSVKSVKYIWSAMVPVGTRLDSSKGLTQVRVLRSSAEDKEKWVDERVNVLDDYRAYFKTQDVPKPAGIAVLTDSDDTKSRAEGDYANFRVCKP